MSSLSELLGHFNLPQFVGSKWKAFGVLLLDDEVGSHIDEIEQICRGRPENAVKEVLNKWLDGYGRDVTWPILIETLRESNLPLLADHIRIKGTVY